MYKVLKLVVGLMAMLCIFLKMCPEARAYQGEGLEHTQNLVPRLCMPVSYRLPATAPKIPTVVGMLSDRYSEVNEALQGLDESGIPLVGKWSGRWEAVPCGDDSGLFYIVPLLAKTMRWSADRALNVFYIMVLLFSTVVGLIGFILCRGGWQVRLTRVIAIIAAVYVMYKAGDVYLVQGAAALIAVPWIYYWYKERRATFWTVVVFFVLGIILGIAQWVRSQSAVPVVIFAMILFGFSSLKSTWKILLIIVMLIGIAMPLTYANILRHRRNAFLAAQTSNFQPALDHHLLWHTVYVGLGYLNNPYVSGWKDVVAADYVQSVSPSPMIVYGGEEYENILKWRVLNIIKNHPQFIFYTLAAKSGVLISFLVLCMNISMINMISQCRQAVEVAFVTAIAYSAIPGLIAIPVPQYVITMIVLSLCYWAIMAPESNMMKRIFQKREENYASTGISR